jgi:hypothetical protein
MRNQIKSKLELWLAYSMMSIVCTSLQQVIYWQAGLVICIPISIAYSNAIECKKEIKKLLDQCNNENILLTKNDIG